MTNYTDKFIDEDTNTFQFKKIIDLFNHKKNGTFVEMGAADGILASNTYKLEKYYGWNGILIEPIKEYFELIPKYRNVNHILNICVGEKEGTVDFTRIEGYSKLLSGITEQYPAEHNYRIDSEVKEKNQKIYVDQVICKKLITVLTECNIFNIDYLSIDVEGGELSVLKSLDMENNNIRPTIIGAENNYNKSDVEYYLKKFNYIKIGNFGGDDFYYNGENK